MAGVLIVLWNLFSLVPKYRCILWPDLLFYCQVLVITIKILKMSWFKTVRTSYKVRAIKGLLVFCNCSKSIPYKVKNFLVILFSEFLGYSFILGRKILNHSLLTSKQYGDVFFYAFNVFMLFYLSQRPPKAVVSRSQCVSLYTS